jgi:hypothetical protein
MATRDERRSLYAEKNRRRREGSKSIYAETGRELRRTVSGGAFGHTEPAVFNKLAEGTAAMRRAETNLEELNGSAKEEPEE